MAKLSARGTTILARVQQCADVTPDGTATDPAYVVVQRRFERALRSDRKILGKITVRYANGTSHDWGWTIHGSLPAGVTPADWAATYRNSGWKVV